MVFDFVYCLLVVICWQRNSVVLGFVVLRLSWFVFRLAVCWIVAVCYVVVG